MGIDGAVFVGRFNRPVSRENVIDRLAKYVNRKPELELFGSENISSVAVVTGGGAVREILDQVVEANIDMYITGEIKEECPGYAKETKLNYVCGGHYATEVCGMKALLGKIKDKFGVEIDFVDLPVKY